MARLALEINSLAGSPLSRKELEALALATLKAADFRKKTGAVLSVAFVSPAMIRKANRTYRKRDEVTDVLSFEDGGRLPEEKGIGKNGIFIGELLICFSFVRKSARMDKISFRKELAFVFVHGLLHLLGFDHGEKMFALQDEVIRKMK